MNIFTSIESGFLSIPAGTPIAVDAAAARGGARELSTS
jgi:hypothetical protein